ncbi:MAG: hypothetical protein AcusKO_50480 [Acuticoccus sp.]
MALLGKGAVAIWHDIAPEGRAAFYDWHGNEHMPERVGIPGFLRGRRYIAHEASLEFFNLYEAEALTVLEGPDYQDRLNSPTPWTVETVKHFRRVNRSLNNVVYTAGPGGGGLIATVRYDAPSEADDAMVADLLPSLAKAPGIAGITLVVADTEASAVDTAERRARGEANVIPTRAILVEGWGDVAPFAALCVETLSAPALATFGARGTVALDTYLLQCTVDTASLG